MTGVGVGTNAELPGLPVEEPSRDERGTAAPDGLKRLPLDLKVLLGVERMGMYGRLLELIEEEAAKEGRSDPWGEFEYGVLRDLRKRAEKALAIEERYGKGCLLNLEDPLVVIARARGKSVTPADVGVALRFREGFPEVYNEFVRSRDRMSETGTS